MSAGPGGSPSDRGPLCCRPCWLVVRMTCCSHTSGKWVECQRDIWKLTSIVAVCRQVQRNIRRAVNSPNSASSKAATRQRGKARADSALRKGVSYSNLDEGVW